MIWLIYSLKDEHLLDAINLAIYKSLLSAKLIEINKDKVYTWKKYHPTKDLVAACFKIGKTPKWDKHILKHIDQKKLVELTDDWTPELPE